MPQSHQRSREPNFSFLITENCPLRMDSHSLQKTKADHYIHINTFVAPGDSSQTRSRGIAETRDKEQ